MEKVISETVSATSSATPSRFTVKASIGSALSGAFTLPWGEGDAPHFHFAA